MTGQLGDMDVAPVESAAARALRDAWLARRQVRVSLTEHCAVQTIVGRVHAVSVTGATVDIDGWVVPTAHVLEVAKPTAEEIGRYAIAMHDLRIEADDDTR